MSVINSSSLNDQAEIRRQLEQWRNLFSPGEQQFSFTGYVVSEILAILYYQGMLPDDHILRVTISCMRCQHDPMNVSESKVTHHVSHMAVKSMHIIR